MNAIEQALALLKRADGALDFGPGVTANIAKAQVYAAIAQAEQLKRIADSTECRTANDEKLSDHVLQRDGLAEREKQLERERLVLSELMRDWADKFLDK